MFDEKYIIQTIPLKIIILALNLIFIYTIKFMKKNLYLMKYKILFLLEAWYWFINYFISNHNFIILIFPIQIQLQAKTKKQKIKIKII